MTVAVAVLVVAGVTVLSITALLVVRRHAPEGSFFSDGDRAAGVFGVLATGFAVLIGFVVFLSFTSYDTARSGAEDEARIVAQQNETAQFLPLAVRKELSGQLVCYARSVVHREWPALAAGDLSTASINPWGLALFRTIQKVEPRSNAEQTAYDTWFQQVSDRETARGDRLHGAQGVIPTPLWIVLFLSAALIFGYMLLFADSGERAFVQATMIGTVAVVLSSTMMLLWFLDNPFHHGVGSLRPVAMERTLTILDQESRLLGGVTPPCDAQGSA